MRVVAPHVDNLGSEEEGYYNLKERYIPLVTEISHKQHILFAKPDEKILRKAFKGADMIHTYLPFLLEKNSRKNRTRNASALYWLFPFTARAYFL